MQIEGKNALMLASLNSHTTLHSRADHHRFTHGHGASTLILFLEPMEQVSNTSASTVQMSVFLSSDLNWVECHGCSSQQLMQYTTNNT